MRIDPYDATLRIAGKNLPSATSDVEEFRRLLQHSQDLQTALNTPPQAVAGSADTQEPLLIGSISEAFPTVSDLLLANPKISRKCWQIIHSEPNRNKPFTTMPAGTQVYLDQQSNELLWQDDVHHPARRNIASSIAAPPAASSSPPTPSTSLPPALQESIPLGVIDQTAPTVSHLLKNHPDFRQDTWNILAMEINQGKPFTHIPTNAMVSIQPLTGELTWQAQDQTSSHMAGSTESQIPSPSTLQHPTQTSSAQPPSPDSAQKSPESTPFTAGLATAVRSYSGRSYDEINCYGLLIRGLTQMGIPYTGEHGLRDRLVRMATEQGLPDNAFFNGEGVIQATGNLVYHKTINEIHDPEAEANKVLAEITPRLEEGAILSFSTQSRGHTGVISSIDEQWTFINSGDLDNTAVPVTRRHKGVGEEVLATEVRNWFRLAGKEHQSLMISLGRLDEEKLSTAMQTPPDRLAAVL